MATDIAEKEIGIECADGFVLAGTVYTAAEQSPAVEAPSVLISAATGAPRGFYASFARALVDAGAQAVLTYDYRGMPASPRPPGWSGRINMRDWARLDMAAAIDRLHDVAPDSRMVGIGHSFGGQALGICGKPGRFDRYCLVASLSGYWRGTDTAWKNLFMMNCVGVPLTALFGRTVPAMGLGDSIPASVFRDWTRWCNHPEYFFDDPQVGARAGYATVEMPLLSVGLTDDLWGTPRAVEGLLKHYVAADINRLWLTPEQAGQPVGHLGFFRSRFRDVLWPPVIGWLLDATPVEGAL
jgi:predicted alpha/beta hydrolase